MKKYSPLSPRLARLNHMLSVSGRICTESSTYQVLVIRCSRFLEHRSLWDASSLVRSQTSSRDRRIEGVFRVSVNSGFARGGQTSCDWLVENGPCNPHRRSSSFLFDSSHKSCYSSVGGPSAFMRLLYVRVEWVRQLWISPPSRRSENEGDALLASKIPALSVPVLMKYYLQEQNTIPGGFNEMMVI